MTWFGLRGNVALFVGSGIAILAYLFFRIPQLTTGFPYIYYWDEYQITSGHLRILLDGSPVLGFFNYGNFPIYFLSFINSWLQFVIWVSPETFITQSPTLFVSEGYRWSLGLPELLFADRVVWLISGMVGMLALGYIGNAFGQWITATFSMFAYALIPFVAMFNVRVTPDGLGMPLLIISLAFLVAHSKAPEMRTWALALSSAFAGMATATKYTYGALAVSIFLVILLNTSASTREKLKRVTVGGVTMAFTFALGNFSMFLKPFEFVNALVYEFNHYQTGGVGVHKSQPGIDHLSYQVNELGNNAGWFLVTFSAAGLFLMIRDGQLSRLIAIAFLTPVTIIGIVLISGELNFHRNLLPAYPLLALSAGFAIQRMSEFVRAKAESLK